MKKFIIVLMVLVVASVLLVGCLPTTPDTTTDTTTDTTVKTDTPFITNIGSISLSSALTQYVSAEPAVSGVGVAGAIIKVYVDGVQSGVGSTGTGGAFTTIPMSMITLTEGVRKLYVTATVPGLAESDKSTEYTFTYDKSAPKIASAVADSSAASIIVTFDEPVNTNLSDTTSTTLTWAKSALNSANWTITHSSFTASTFLTVSDKAIRITGSGPITSGAVFTVSSTGISDLRGVTSTTATTYMGVAVP